MKTIALRHIAQIAPPVPEFDLLPEDAEVGFLPLEAVWSDDRADHSRTATKSAVMQGYTRYQAGDVLVPKVTPTFQAGRAMRSVRLGAGTTELHVLRALDGVDPRWVNYAVRSNHFLQEGVASFQGVAGLQRVPAEFVLSFHVADINGSGQRQIADFLDDRVARIDRLSVARLAQVELMLRGQERLSYETVGGVAIDGSRRATGVSWLPDLPAHWPLLSVASQFSVDLGKMLDEKRQTGEAALPYLRNTNVQWDHVYTDDLKEMDIAPAEYERYTVRPGDLLICEGGQPGRAAIWQGEITPLGYQKALHRARSRGAARPAWLLECLRVAVDLDVFGAGSGQTTIAHLTNEKLREQRFPFPPPQEQDALLATLARDRARLEEGIDSLTRSIELLNEYKQSLITAAVTGQIDVTAFGSNILG